MTDERVRDDRARDDRLSAIVAIIIAFTTLVAAVAGFLQAEAGNNAGDRRDEAEQLSLQALSSSQSAQQNAQVELDTFARWVEQRTEAANTLLASIWASSDPERENELELDAARWEAVAAATLQQSDIQPDSEFGPDQDPTFPSRYFAAATEDSLFRNALQDAANEEASQFDQRAASYTAILAMTAVALYLFGLTLAVSGRGLRLGFLSVGLGMLGVALLWMFQSLAIPIPATNDEAAAEYARGRAAQLTAFDAAGYQAAEAHYSRAIELRPTFARAYRERAGVIVAGASPQRTGFISIAPPEALERARRDLQTARGFGLEGMQTFGDLGFYGFVEGVQQADIGLLNQSVENTRRAILIDPGEPVFRYNLAVALAAAARFDEARSAYQDAVNATLYIDAANGVLRQEPYVEEFWLAGALTDLEIVRRHATQLQAATGRTDYEAQILGFKQQIVGRVASQTVDEPPQSPATFNNIVLQVFPAEVQWQGEVANYDPERDTIAAQWYYNDSNDTGWAVIPEVSLTRDPTDNGQGGLFQLTTYMTAVRPPRCLPPGRYRVEIYVNGRLAAEGGAESSFGDLEAFAARDLTMAFCRPHDWQRRDDRLPGLIDGFVSPDGVYGVYAARYSIPGSVAESEDLPGQMIDATLEAFPEWFPATPSYLEDAADQYFLGLSETKKRWYDYGTGYLRMDAGVSPDGSVVIGMLYGPYEWFDGTEPTQILNSMIHFP